MSRIEKYSLTLAVVIALITTCTTVSTFAWGGSAINSQVEANTKQIGEILVLDKEHREKHDNDPVIVLEIAIIKKDISDLKTAMDLKIDKAFAAIIAEIRKK